MKPKILILVIAFVVVAAVLGGLGYYFWSQKGAAPAPGVTPIAVPQEEPKEEVMTPLKLEYSLKNFGPGGESTLTYFLENKKKCNNREAYLGVVKIQGQEQGAGAKPANFPTQYAKITVFADNGEMAVSQWGNEENMAFDSATSFYNDFDIPLIMNSLFAYAGKNFNAPENWQSETPILLKNISTGRSVGDYSIIRQEEDQSGLLPCTKFKIIAKTNNTNGYFIACLAKQVNNVPLPFVVSFAFENQQGPSWQLKSFASEKSGVALVPQCLEPVVCTFVPELSQAERSECDAKKGRVESEFDEKGCVIKYKCMTELDQAEAAVKRVQRTECQVNQGVLNKYMGCLKNNQPNFSPVRYDESGCLLDITCRP